MTTDKSHEARLRRMAVRQGLRLQKSRRRDPRALGYGGYVITDPATDSVVAGELNGPRSLSLAEAEAWLTGRKP